MDAAQNLNGHLAFRRVRSQKLVHLGTMALLLMPIMGLTVEPNAEAASRDASLTRARARAEKRAADSADPPDEAEKSGKQAHDLDAVRKPVERRLCQCRACGSAIFLFCSTSASQRAR
jgi:hypothetical protein